MAFAYVDACSGKPEANFVEGSVPDSPLLFIDKQIVDITFKDVYMQGQNALLYTKCEVYPNQGFATDVCASHELQPSLIH